MNEDKFIVVDKRTNNLALRFHVRGFQKQFFISTGLIDNPLNRHLVRLKRDAILIDIAFEKFDPTLSPYQFKPTRNTPTAIVSAFTNEPEKPRFKHDLKELWQRFTNYKKALLEETTILVRYKAVEQSIDKLPTKELSQAIEIRDWLLENKSHYMAWDNLMYFSHCCDWSVDNGLIHVNPFEKLKLKKPKKKSTDESNYRAFTLEERDLIIEAFANHRTFSHYTSLVKFLFWTGCRPGEVFALQWGDISEDCCSVIISKSRNLKGIAKGTKNGKKRTFPTVQGSKLQQLLLTIRPLDCKVDDLVFVSKEGKRVRSDNLNDAWNWTNTSYKGKPVRYAGVVRQLADNGKVPYLPPYSCRHTFATWAIAKGATPDQVAKWIGDEVATVLAYYVHPEVVRSVCPDF